VTGGLTETLRILERLRHWFEVFLENSEEVYMRIVHNKKYGRLVGLLDRSHGTVSYGVGGKLANKIVKPTAVTNVTIDGKY
jgi:hypothetical protein